MAGSKKRPESWAQGKLSQDNGINVNKDFCIEPESKKFPDFFFFFFAKKHVFGHFVGYNQSVTLIVGHFTRITKIQVF
jgi:hypothetical protein